jgi:hypothetical protein
MENTTEFSKYGNAEVSKVEEHAYSKRHCRNTARLMIDSNDDGVYIAMTEYRIDTNRETGISISLTHDEWNQLKAILTGHGKTI